MAPACRHCGKQHDVHLTACPVTGERLGSGPHTLVNEDDVLIGSVVAERYQVLAVLGQGSTGTVFAVERLGFGRTAALKVLRPRFMPLEDIRDVFAQETLAVLGIRHPSLCDVFDVGALPDGSPFFVMELLEGDTLASRLGRERFSATAALDIMMQLLSGMDALHERRFVLGDLRPQNVFLARRRGCRPVLKILDLGLTRLIPMEEVRAEWKALGAVASAADVTGLRTISYYLSPERARGEQAIGPPSDLFLAAVLLYEGLTGVKPFTATSWTELMAEIAASQPARLSALRPELPEKLETLLARALAADPRERPPSAQEMQEELRGALDGSRRGSSAVRSSVRAGPFTTRGAAVDTTRGAAVDSLAATPRRADRSAQVPPSAGMETQRASVEVYEDESRTERKAGYPSSAAVTLDAFPTRSRPLPAAGRSAAEAAAPPSVEIHVAPPSGEIDVDVELDVYAAGSPATSQEGDLDTTLRIPRSAKQPHEDDETATTKLTPELRDRISQIQMAPNTNPPSTLEAPKRPLKPPRVR